jgi:sentrin-specific protease 7
LKRLEPGVYFNDSLIDLKIKYLINQLTDEAKKTKIHAFSCLFYAKLTELRDPKAAHDLVCRWTKNINLFDLDFILFPINSSNHWSLCVIVRPWLLVRKLIFVVYL